MLLENNSQVSYVCTEYSIPGFLLQEGYLYSHVYNIAKL